MIRKNISLLITLLALTALFASHVKLMMINYFSSSWWFFDENWSYPFVRPYQHVIMLAATSYILAISAVLVFRKIEKPYRKYSVSGLLMLSASFLFFLSGEYVVVSDLTPLLGSKNNSRTFRIEERFSIFTIRSQTYNVTEEKYFPSFGDSFLTRQFHLTEGKTFSVVRGIGSEFNLQDPKWSYLHVMLHQGNTYKIPKEDDVSEYE